MGLYPLPASTPTPPLRPRTPSLRPHLCPASTAGMADATEQRKKRTFRKFSYRGIDLDQLLDLSSEQLTELVTCRARRKFKRGMRRKPLALVKTHLRNMIVVPEMIGSIIGIYNGKTFNQVEIRAEMVGQYLGEFSIPYKPVKHGRPGIGATNSSRFIPLK